MSRSPVKVGSPTSLYSDIPLIRTCTACCPPNSSGSPVDPKVNGGSAVLSSPSGGPPGSGEPVSNTKVTKSAAALVKEGYLLAGDAPSVVKRATDHWEFATHDAQN